MTRRPLTGPAAYHAQKAAGELAALRADVARMRAELIERPSKVGHELAIHDAAVRAYLAGHADGWKAGAFDALCSVAPRHTEALAQYGA